MTRRSIFLGLLGAAFVGGFCFLNDWVLRQTYLVGNNMPASIYGLLLLTVLVVNPILRRWSLSGRELAVIMALTLAGASIPGGGLLRTLIPSLVMPHHLQKTQPGWQDNKVVEAVPPRLLVDVSEDEDHVVGGFVQGLGVGGNHIQPSRVPWRAWARPLGFWLPMSMTLWIGLIGLALAMHRQWAEHEHLPYPIARFTESLLPEPGKTSASLLRDRLFLVTAGIVFAVHLNNFGCTWFPDYLIPVPTDFDFRPLGKLAPWLTRGGGGMLLRPHLYLIIIGIAYFIPGDVCLSFGVGPFLWHLLTGWLIGYGIDLMAPVEGWSYFSVQPQSFALFGAAAGVGVSLLYTGRQYYTAVLRRACGLASAEAVGGDAVWGLRVFLVCFLLLVGQLALIGLDWTLALAATLIMVMGFVVLGRIIAETGLIYLKCYFWPCATLWGLFGALAVGPHQLLLLMLVSTVLFIDPREALYPFMVNSLKVLDMRRVRLGGPAVACALAVLVALAVSVPVTLYIKYDMGSATGDSWSTVSVPRTAFENQVLIRRKLAAQGASSEETGSFLGRLGAANASPLCVAVMVAGLVLVLGFTAARLRFPWWPLHPLLFVTWCSTPLRWMGPSYLLAWFLKAAIVRYGGSKIYNRLKPLFLGLIAGEVLGALFPALFGVFYYFITGNQPRMFNVIPG
ncbi:MAG: hypothetical protein RBU25_06670 [Lentisphaeria bacterium]|jgi:hypothetical protein|nr:hypothetical protein [Lentisphaeria bacterium]